ncbi:MAG: SDR family NAD(P)-dependent oxidoreductase [Methylococcaceae bacterium]|nr:SDR family NAD(P)-dependent oxidoreductase [Methylococcaceae bacterium]
MKGEHEPIAIIGIGCRYPGKVTNAESLWKMLMGRIDAVTEIPQDRWNIERYYSKHMNARGKAYSKWGGFIDNIDQFDPECFSISPREANFMDPQQRLLLEVTWDALEDSGHPIDTLSGSNTGVFIGLSTNDYSQIQLDLDEPQQIDPHTATGGAFSIAANRISYCFDFHGPSLVVDTACSSSLVAIHQACASIFNDECDIALAGGANLILLPTAAISFSAATMLSPDGRCKSFDASANGFVRGEGVGVVVLKRLSAAVANKDCIYAVINGTGVNQDGRTNGISLPGKEAQSALIESVYQKAGIDRSQVFYVEAHGTGTAVGDPIEAEVLGEMFGCDRADSDKCIIGSIKTNIGHLESAAGLAGLIKAALCIKHQMIPPNLHFLNPNPNILFDELNIQVPVDPILYPKTPGKKMIVGVNSFGFGGTNAHAILSEYTHQPQQFSATSDEQNVAYILPLSARSKDGLKILAQSYVDFLGASNKLDIVDLVYTASNRKNIFAHRLSLVVANFADTKEQLQAFINAEPRIGMSNRQCQCNTDFKIAYVFSGQGPQWWAMGRELLQKEVVFREKIIECDYLLSQYADWSLLTELTAAEENSRISETEISQPLLFALQVSLVALWKSRGIEPDAVVGHSVGEVAAAHISGALDLANAIKVIFFRGLCMSHATGSGGMMAVALSPEQANQEISSYSGKVSIAAINSPSSVTVSGQPDLLTDLANKLNKQSIYNKILKVQFAFHSVQMDPVKDELLTALDDLELDDIHIPIYSTVLAKKANENGFNADYWWRNVRKKVCFAPAIQNLIADGYNIFIEIGPHPVLSSSILECAQASKITVIPSLRRNEDECCTMLGALGNLYTTGYAIDWNHVHKYQGQTIHLPGYPWQKQHYWNESEKWFQRRAGKIVHPLLMVKSDSGDPTWNTLIDLSCYSYLLDHKVRDKVVFPAAGYVEMAMAAASELLETDTFVVEDIQIQKVLYIKEDNIPTLQFSMNASDSSFVIRSCTLLVDKTWTTHCIGYLRINSKIFDNINLDELQKSMDNVISVEDAYQRFSNSGLLFGPAFRGLTAIHTRDGEALARVQLLDVNQQHSHQYHFHPAVLDACFQTLFGTLPMQLVDNLFLPVAIDQLRYYDDAQSEVWVHAQRIHANSNTLVGNLSIYSCSGQPLVEILGFRCRGLGVTHTEQNELDELYQYQWLQSPLYECPHPRKAAEFLPSCAQIVESIEQPLNALSLQIGGWGELDRMASRFNDLAINYIIKFFIDIGCAVNKGNSLSIDRLIADLGVQENYRRLLHRFFQILEQQNYIQKHGAETGIVLQPFTTSDLKSEWSSALSEYAGAFAELSLIRSCGEKLVSVLKGEQDPLKLIFPENSSIIVEQFYTDSPSSKPYNLMLKMAMENIVDSLPCGKNLRVLEIGAGTGGLTANLLDLFTEDRVEYFFTDISSAFLPSAEHRFKDYPFIKYQLLDIEKDIQQQGFQLHSFDIVLASNVLHATENLADSLENIYKLLVPSGLLLFLEVEEKYPWLDMIFGLTDGWWRYTDIHLRPDHPLIPRDDWKNLMQAKGYISPIVLPESAEKKETQQILVIAQVADTLTKQANVFPDVVENQDKIKKHWLIFADQFGVALDLSEQIKQRGDSYTLIFAGDEYKHIGDNEYEVIAGNKQHLTRLLEELTVYPEYGIVHLWSLDIPQCAQVGDKALLQSEVLGCHTVMFLIQALTESGLQDKVERFLLITKGAQAIQFEAEKVAFEQSALIGLARVIENEHPELKCKTVDLDPNDYSLNVLYAELITDNMESEVVFRYGERYAPKLKLKDKPYLYVDHGSGSETIPFQLEVEQAGAINNLRLMQSLPTTLEKDQIEIQVHTASLNFRDVMKALGLIILADDGSDSLLGDECAGIVTAIGSEIKDYKVGDRVVAVALGSFSSKVITNRPYVMHTPPHLSDEQAVTIPIVFLTVYYALLHLARIKKGDKVLIQAAAGGVGLAAVQIAKHIGAEVFVTAGSNVKRELLEALGADHIMDSRSLAFSDEILSITAGQGVDVVLNSLAGDAIVKGIDCMAPYGRFLELGKVDIYQNSKLGLWAFRKNLAFFAIDLSRMLVDKPDLLSPMLKDVYQLINDRVLSPLPYRVFPISQIKEAFYYMAQGKHIGKVVVSMRENSIPVVPLVETRQAQFYQQASYLITGGFGGFGITLAHWIIQQGGNNIILAGRSGGESEQAQKAITELQATGANISVLKADVSDINQFSEQLDMCLRNLPPLKGIFHLAMVLKDGVITQLDAERFSQVMAPKVQGTWNLHHLSIDKKLDYFVLFSSVTALLGNAGQGSYVAANQFLDMFAHFRRSQGLPAISINWGALLEVGYLNQYQNISKQMEEKGFRGLLPNEAMQFLQKILIENPVQIGPAHFNWYEWGKKYQNRKIPLRYSLLIDETQMQANLRDDSGSIRMQIDQADPEQYALIISHYMREQVAAVLRISADKLKLEQSLNELGLDSLMMVELGIRIENDLSISLPTSQLMQASSLNGLSKAVLKLIGKASSIKTDSLADNSNEPKYPDSLITIKPGGGKTLFCFHPAGGLINDYNVLAEKLPDEIQVMGLQSCVYAGAEQEFSSIALMAEEYVKLIQKYQPEGPYSLLGYSLGGVVSLAVALKLLNLNQQVSFVGLIDSEIDFYNKAKKDKFLNRIIPEMIHFYFNEISVLKALSEVEQQQNIKDIQQLMIAAKDDNFEDIFIKWLKTTKYQADEAQMDVFYRYLKLFRKHADILSENKPKALDKVPVYVWQASEGNITLESEREYWNQWSTSVNFEVLSGNHYSILKPPMVEILAEQIGNCMMVPGSV